MQQPYEITPECNYRAKVPLEPSERRIITLWKLALIVPLALVSVAIMVLVVVINIDTTFTDAWSDIAAFIVALVIFIKSIQFLSRSNQYKEVFESEVSDELGLIFLRYIYVKDKIGRLGSLPFTFKSGRVKIGRRYRFHKLANKDLLLQVEDVPEEV